MVKRCPGGQQHRNSCSITQNINGNGVWMNFIDHDELTRRMKRRKRRQRSDVFWNFMTICTILATIAMAAVFLMIFSNPSISINPFPPPTMPVLVIYPTATPTLSSLPATWTPTVGLATETPEPVIATATSELSLTTAAPTITKQPAGEDAYTFALQGAPTGLKSEVFKPATGCTWQGVAGLVVDMQSKPLVNIMIILKGSYDGKTISTQTISGTHTEYGESGYEFQLGTAPITSNGLLSIQLVDQAGLPLSEEVIFDTYGTCDKNLVLINFKQVK